MNNNPEQPPHLQVVRRSALRPQPPPLRVHTAAQDDLFEEEKSVHRRNDRELQGRDPYWPRNRLAAEEYKPPELGAHRENWRAGDTPARFRGQPLMIRDTAVTILNQLHSLVYLGVLGWGGNGLVMRFRTQATPVHKEFAVKTMINPTVGSQEALEEEYDVTE
ncbi:hypothetical protein QBC35DRAFT_468007, partial [Podospora australis]